MSAPIPPTGILLVGHSSSRSGLTGEGDRSSHSSNGGGGGDSGGFLSTTTRATTPRHIADLRYEADQKVGWVVSLFFRGGIALHLLR